MEDLRSFLSDRKSMYQKRANTSYEQEQKVRALLNDEPEREDLKSDLYHAIKLQDRYNALVMFIEELQQDYLDWTEENLTKTDKRSVNNRSLFFCCTSFYHTINIFYIPYLRYTNYFIILYKSKEEIKYDRFQRKGANF